MTDIILAMPSLCDSTDFGLSTDSDNQKKAQILLKKKSSHLIETIGFHLEMYQFGSKENGGYFVYNPITRFIVYYMQYKSMNKKLVGTLSVTQTSVWTSIDNQLPAGFVSEVMIRKLLKIYPAIMSDRLHTEDGRRLWLRMLFRAYDAGYAIGLADFNAKKFHKFIDRSDLNSWYSNKHQGIRFVIYRKET